jgi:hypothetical protein
MASPLVTCATVKTVDYALAAEFQSYDTPEHHEFVKKFLGK